MLLPTVAELQVSDLRDNLPKLIRKVVFCCFSLGFLCMAGFFVLGNIMGNLIFHNSEAGNFIITLAFICPFLYTNTALISILNGLGKTSFTFLTNTAGFLLLHLTASCVRT